jgi:hypothetical protein
LALDRPWEAIRVALAQAVVAMVGLVVAEAVFHQDSMLSFVAAPVAG